MSLKPEPNRSLNRFGLTIWDKKSFRGVKKPPPTLLFLLVTLTPSSLLSMEFVFNSKSHLHDSLFVDYYDWLADIHESLASHHLNHEPLGYGDLSLSAIQSFSEIDMYSPPPPPSSSSSFVDCYRLASQAPPYIVRSR